MTKGGGGKFVGKFALHNLEGFREIRFAGDEAWNVVTGDEVIDLEKERIDGGIKLVEVCRDGDFCFASPLCGLARGGGVVSIHEKRASRGNPVALQFRRLQGETVVMTAENSALASGVNENERLIAGTAGRSEKLRFNANALEGGAMDLRGVIVTEFSDIARA